MPDRDPEHNYSRTPLTQTRVTRTRSDFPQIWPHFPVIYYQLTRATRTLLNWTKCTILWLKFALITRSLDKNVVRKMSKCWNVADWHLPFFNRDWYNRGNISENVICLSKLSKLSSPKTALWTEMTVDCHWLCHYLLYYYNINTV